LPHQPQQVRLPRRRLALWLLLAVTLIGLLLRVYRINDQSVRTDEVFSITVSRLPWGEMADRLIEDFNHPPLHYYVMHGWFAAVGFGVFQSRMLSAVFGTLAIVMIFVLARYLFDTRTALLSAVLLAVSQLSVMYSQEARMYAQALLLAVCTVFSFVVAIRERRASAWWAFIVLGVLMTYTHYYSLLVVLSLLLYAATRHRRYPLPLSWWIGGGILAAVLYLPWLTTGVVQQAINSHQVTPAELPPWYLTRWSTPIAVVAAFNNSLMAGVLNSPPLWAVAAGALLFSLPAAWAARVLVNTPADADDVTRRENIVLLLVLGILPVAITLIAGAFGVQFDVRYIAFCVVPYYVLVARGIATMRPATLQFVAVVLILLFSASALRANYYMPYKENYRDAFAYVANHRQPGDCWLFLPLEDEPARWGWRVYHDEPELRFTPLAEAVAEPGRCPRLWVIEYRRRGWLSPRIVQGLRALETGHTRIDQQEYFWMHVGLFVPKGPAPHK